MSNGGTNISDDDLFELFTKVFEKVDSTRGDFWYLFNNISMLIFNSAYRNEICFNMKAYNKYCPSENEQYSFKPY
jgi:hypothetical protein